MQSTTPAALLLCLALCAALALAGCSPQSAATAVTAEESPVVEEAAPAEETTPVEEPAEEAEEETVGFDAITVSVSDYSGGICAATEQFTERDLTQNADLSDAVYHTVSDGEDITIIEAGVYVLSGTASNVTVYVEAASDAKVQLVLDGVSVTNDDFPCIYVKSADKVFVTTSADSALSVTGAFAADGETNTDGVIFSRSDLTMSGTAALTISSTANGVTCKDDLKITGGTYYISAATKCFEANDSIRIAGGIFTLTAGTDAIHAENAEDDTLGYVFICGGELRISAGDDGIHGVPFVQIDDGTFSISASEGIEATYVQINGGSIDISATDDGVNAAQKSGAYRATIEINDGYITIVMASGDTDGVDSNGDITINGGVIDVTGNSTFDCDGTATYNGGTIIVNGQEVDTIPSQTSGGMGWGMRGGR